VVALHALRLTIYFSIDAEAVLLLKVVQCSYLQIEKEFPEILPIKQSLIKYVFEPNAVKVRRVFVLSWVRSVCCLLRRTPPQCAAWCAPYCLTSMHLVLNSFDMRV